MSRPSWLRSAKTSSLVEKPGLAKNFDILFICTGNICRSAYAHLRLQHSRPDISVGSAGIGALVGNDIDRTMGTYLPTDVRWPRHHAQQLTPPLLEASDLILPMEEVHVDWIAETLPRAANKTIPLRTLGRLLRQQPPAGPRTACELAQHYSGITDMALTEADAIADPYRRSERIYQQAVAQIDEALELLVRYLAA